jgi:hypothetical protein
MRIESENIGDISPSQVRIPSELKEKLKRAAKENQQSMNAEIVRRLEKSFFESAGKDKKESIVEQLENATDSDLTFIQLILDKLFHGR